MAYPCIKPWLEYRLVSDSEFEVENNMVLGDWEAEPPRFSSEFVEFMQRLDGKTNPYGINQTLSRATVKRYLQTLDEHGFLREKRRNHDLGRFTIPIVQFHGETSYSRIAVALNRLLLFLWIPALISGVIACIHTLDDIEYSVSALAWGTGLGLVFGTTLHEIGHFLAARAYSAPVYELGVEWRIIPSAYNLIDPFTIKNRIQRAQIFAAGIEMNLFLGGLLGLLTLVSSGELQTILFYAALQNAGLALISLCFLFPCDGFKTVITLLGADDMLFSMVSALVCPRITWEEQREKGAAGIAAMVCTVALSLAQLAPIIYLLFVIAEVTT